MELISYRDPMWKCIVSQPTELSEETLCRCFAFHGISSGMVQYVECEYSFRPLDTCWI